MPNFANIQLIGHVGKVDEIKYIGKDNTPVLKFSLCVNTGFGEKKTASWYTCQFFGTRCEKLAQFITKGKALLVCGEPTIREWEANGKKGTSIEIRVSDITLLGGKDEGGHEQQAPAAAQSGDDSIPF